MTLHNMHERVTVISPKSSGVGSVWREMWDFRAFFKYLVQQTTKRRFQETILGPTWLLLRPLIPSVAAIFIFTRIVPVSSGDLPYPIFYFAGFTVWGLFAGIVSFVPRVMRMHRGLMKKMYFPRLLIPLSSLGVSLAEFGVVMAVFAFLVLFFAIQGSYNISIGPQLALFPILFCLTVVLGVSVGVIVGVLSLVAKDILYTLPHFLQVWMLVTPVIFSIQVVPEKFRWIVYLLNPVATLVDSGRWALVSDAQVHWALLMITAIEICSVAYFATRFFQRAEGIFIDEI